MPRLTTLTVASQAAEQSAVEVEVAVVFGQKVVSALLAVVVAVDLGQQLTLPLPRHLLSPHRTSA